MKEYPKELEKDMIKALVKLVGFNHIHMAIDDFKSFLNSLENFCKSNDLIEIYDKAMDAYIIAMDMAIREVLK